MKRHPVDPRALAESMHIDVARIIAKDLANKFHETSRWRVFIREFSCQLDFRGVR